MIVKLLLNAVCLCLACLNLAACNREDSAAAEDAVGQRAPIAGAETGEPAKAPQVVDTTRRTEAASAVQRFGSQLRAELQQAMAEGGPLLALDVCHLRAPAIADELSQHTGFQLARVSLKNRNPNRGQPTPWQVDVLETFDQQLAAGTPVSELTFDATTEDEYRFMRAIPTAPLCLTCHGTAIEPTLQAAITALYPQDLATGYGTGELRGAFVALQAIDPAAP